MSRKSRKRRKRQLKLREREDNNQRDDSVVFFQGHKDRINEILHFPKHDKLVTCSLEADIKIWCSKTGKFEKVIKSKKEEVLCMLAYDDEHFIAFQEHELGCFSILTGTRVKYFQNVFDMELINNNQRYLPHKSKVFRLIRLTDDLFLIHCYSYTQGSRVLIYSYQENDISESIKSHFKSNATILESKTIKNCLIFTSKAWKVTTEVRMVDWTTDEVIKRFEISIEDHQSYYIHHTKTFVDTEGIEILVTGTDVFGDLYFFDISREIPELIKVIEHSKLGSNPKQNIKSLEIIRNDYVICGNEICDLSLFRVKHLMDYRVFLDGTRNSLGKKGEISYIKYLDHEKFSCRLAVVILDGNRGQYNKKVDYRIKIVEVKKGIRLEPFNEKEMTEMDLNDRMGFLKEDGEELMGKRVFVVKTLYKRFSVSFKCLM